MNPKDFDLKKPEEMLGAFLKKNSIGYVNIQEKVNQYEKQHILSHLFIVKDGHPTKEGHALIGKIIFDAFFNK